MKIKKVVIVYSGAKHQGGVERYLENFFRLYDKKKMKLVLVSLGEWPLCKKIGHVGGKVMVLAGGRVTPQNILKISKIVSEEGASLIVSQGVVANSYARSAAVLAKVPHLTTVHSDLDLDYSNPLVRSVYNVSDRVVRWKTDRYIAVSEYLKTKLIKSGIKSNKVLVVYNGVELENRKPNSRKTKQPGGEVIIGSIGRLHKVKGYDRLIEAFSEIDTTGLRLMIWGEGEERKKLEKKITEAGMESKAELCGYSENLGDVFSKIDIYVQPSLSEGFGITVVEAMIASKPIVVTPAGALKEIIIDGKNGIVAKGFSAKALAAAMERAFEDPSRLAEIAAQARKDALERFSVRKWIKATEDAYMETAK